VRLRLGLFTRTNISHQLVVVAVLQCPPVSGIFVSTRVSIGLAESVQEMLTDTRLRKLKPKAKAYQLFDGGGLCIEVLPSGSKVWRYRYRLGGKQEMLTLGTYPLVTLLQARRAHLEAKALVREGQRPAASKQRAGDTLAGFAPFYIETLPEGTYKHETRRILDKDVLPLWGARRLSEINAGDVVSLTDRIKARGAPYTALCVRNVLRRLYGLAIARQLVAINPAAQIPARYIATRRPRDRVLSRGEIAELLGALARSRSHLAHRIAVHLLLITLVRKGELINARWEEVNLDTGEWTIPGRRMKMDRPHVVYLSRQAVEMFRELKPMACGSAYVFPSRADLDRPIVAATLNKLIQALGGTFCPHDFRRTASTYLHEMGFTLTGLRKR
jgi:integrase